MDTLNDDITELLLPFHVHINVVGEHFLASVTELAASLRKSLNHKAHHASSPSFFLLLLASHRSEL